MSITHVGSSVLVTSATQPTINITDAILAVGNYLLVAVTLNKGTVDLQPPDGTWTELVDGFNNAGVSNDRHEYAVFYKRVTSYAGGVSYAFTKDTDDNLLFAGLILTFDGHLLSGTLIDAAGVGVTATTTQTDDVSFPAYDPSGPVGGAADVHVMFVAFYGNDLTGFSAAMSADTNPDCTTRVDLESSAGTDVTLALTSGNNDGGNIAARTWASNSTANAANTGVVFAVNPEPPPAADLAESEWLGAMVHAARRRSARGFRLKRGLLALGFEPEVPEPPPEFPEDFGGKAAPVRRPSRWIFPRRAPPAFEFEQPAEPDFDFGGGFVRVRVPRWRFPRRAPWQVVEFEAAPEVVDFDAGGGMVHAARRRTFSGWKFRAGVRPGGFEFEAVEEPEPEAPVVDRRPLSEYVKFELGHRQGIKFDRR